MRFVTDPELLVGGTRGEDYVAELREQAAEVRTELELATSKRNSLARNALGVLSLAIFAYGFASESMATTAGLFQLLTTLGLLHQLGSRDSQHARQLQSKPGYVLVAAESILQHAEGKA